MKKKMLTILVIGIAAAVLTACTRADNGGNAAAGSGSTTSGSGTITQQNPTGNPAGGTDAGSSSGTDTGAGSQGTADNGQINNGGSSSGTVEGGSTAGTEAPQQPVTEAPIYEENYEDDFPDAQNEDETEELEVYLDMDKPWDGTYISDAGETLTVSVSDSNVSFSFANAGLSGTARQDGNQAVYNGDDHHSIVLEYAGTDIKVTVVSEEDFDTSTSPLNGVYVRQ